MCVTHCRKLQDGGSHHAKTLYGLSVSMDFWGVEALFAFYFLWICCIETFFSVNLWVNCWMLLGIFDFISGSEVPQTPDRPVWSKDKLLISVALMHSVMILFCLKMWLEQKQCSSDWQVTNFPDDRELSWARRTDMSSHSLFYKATIMHADLIKPDAELPFGASRHGPVIQWGYQRTVLLLLFLTTAECTVKTVRWTGIIPREIAQNVLCFYKQVVLF